jgi:UDPglucose 6-dehydrogenase
VEREEEVVKVCIIGTGYVGLVTGASLAYLGNEVVCVDVDEAKIERLRAGISPIYEPGIEELIEVGIRESRLSFTADLSEAVSASEVIYIAVGTPPLPDGSSDLRYLKSAAQGVGRAIVASHDGGKFRVIINKSTVPVGCGNWVETLIREQMRKEVADYPAAGDASGEETSRELRGLVEEMAATFAVVSNPEFLREGCAIGDTFYPDRIVIGSNDERAISVLRELYRPLTEQTFDPPKSIGSRPQGLSRVPLVTTDLTSAEMIKYAANAFLAMKISFANEMANICERVGADIGRVGEGIGLDSRIGPRFLNAGIGWGGSCFGKDISALIETALEYGYRPVLLESAKAVNSLQRGIVIQKLQGSLRVLKGRTIGLMGLAFKPETDDVRDAPSYDVIRALLKMGARVKVYDPVAMSSFRSQHPDLEITYSSGLTDLASDCDALVVVTEWAQFRGVRLGALRRVMKGSVLVDGRNLYDPSEAAGAGFKYYGVGRAAESHEVPQSEYAETAL